MIEFINATIGHNNNAILKNISFSISDNEKVFVIGKSGIGKTTLINSIYDQASLLIKGKVKVDNIDFANKKLMKEKIKSFSFISQISYLLEDESVFNNIYRNSTPKSRILKFFGIASKSDTEKILSTLEQVGLFDKAFTSVSELSGGEKQRVNIAIMIIKKCNYLMVDEPTTSLDIKTSKEIMNIILSYPATSLIIIHQLELIPKNSRVLSIKNNKIIYDGLFKDIPKKILKELYDEPNMNNKAMK